MVEFQSDSKSIADPKQRILLIWQIVQKFVREHGLMEMFISCVIYALSVGFLLFFILKPQWHI